MVIARIMGGLGNQMFQYAMARRLAYVNDAELKLDIHWYQNNPGRAYELDRFNIIARYAARSECRQYSKANRITRKMHRVLARHFPALHPSGYIIEGAFEFNNHAFSSKPPVYIEGNWQSEKYFADIKDIILREFTLRSEVDPENRRMAESVQDCNSVAVHIRRGDYVEERKNTKVYARCSLDYYRQAIETVAARHQELRLFVFTDDRAWAVNNIRFDLPTTLVRHNDPDRGIMDMWLMSQCRYHIIANSTFSWWGAWLCRQSDKIVIAPSRWFLDRNMTTSDLIPGDWIILQN